MKHLILALFWVLCTATGTAQQPMAPVPLLPPPGTPDSILVTVILKHQQDKNLPEIKRILEAQSFWNLFPIPEARVVNWTLAMGLGHVVTLLIPHDAVRRLNLAIENGAWGAFDSEFYLSYDYRRIWEENMAKRREIGEDKN
jgi:hypothetical protein